MSTLYNLDGIHNTLIDINGISKYFDCVVTISPSTEDSGKKFKVGIVSQDELDSGNIKTKDVIGSYSTNIKKDSGDFQNFFLYLQSAEPMKDIEVDIQIAELFTPAPEQPVQQRNTVDVEPSNRLYIKLAIALLIVIIGIVMMRRFYKESS
jgi:hypothetical protein